MLCASLLLAVVAFFVEELVSLSCGPVEAPL